MQELGVLPPLLLRFAVISTRSRSAWRQVVQSSCSTWITMRVSMMSSTSTTCTMVKYDMWTLDCRHTGSNAGFIRTLSESSSCGCSPSTQCMILHEINMYFMNSNFILNPRIRRFYSAVYHAVCLFVCFLFISVF